MAKPITILYVSDSTTVSGAEHVMFHYLEHLREPEFRTHVYFRASNERMRRALDTRGIPYTATESFTNRIIRTTWKPADLVSFAQAFTAVKRELVDLCVRESVDVLHAISYPASLYTAFAAKALHLPQVWHEHNIKRIHAFNAPIYRWAADSCAHVIGPSDAVTMALSRAGIEAPRLHTVYNGIDLGRFVRSDEQARAVRQEFGLADGQPAIGLAGQLLPYKGHRTLIEAAPAVLQSHPSARFFIIGALENPPYEAELRSLIQSNGLQDRFTFTGWRSDIHNVIAAMDVCVVATLTPEPAALSLMEAMALGCPMIATRTGGTPELIVDGQTGLLFTPGQSGELSARIIAVLGDTALRARMAAAGRRRMEDCFSLERHLDEMSALYRSCAAGGHYSRSAADHAAAPRRQTVTG